MSMRVFYFLSQYISLQNVGLEYIECLKLLGCHVSSNLAVENNFSEATTEEATQHLLDENAHNPAILSKQALQALKQADVVILHEEPIIIPKLFNELPILHEKRVIAFVAWENEQLSPFYVAPLSMVSEIWTCSQFSRQAIAKHFSNVSVLPHVVRRTPPNKEDLLWAREQIAHHIKQNSCLCHSDNNKQGCAIFLSVIDAINPRKNLNGLLNAFAHFQSIYPNRAILLLKQYRENLDTRGLPGVISINESLSPMRMAALHVLSSAYVSAHHAEGWGLGLSEAMAFGKPVVATGYSGNMEFMNHSNSIPVRYHLVPVSDKMVQALPFFTKEMFWAEPDTLELAKGMAKALETKFSQVLGKEAAKITKEFSRSNIAARMAELLKQSE